MACVATTATVNGTARFERLCLATLTVRACIAAVFTRRGYDADANRALRRAWQTLSPPFQRRVDQWTDQAHMRSG